MTSQQRGRGTVEQVPERAAPGTAPAARPEHPAAAATAPENASAAWREGQAEPDEQQAGPVAEQDVQRAVRERLARRTTEILERSAAPEDPQRAEREKAVVHECRYLMRLLASRRRSAGEMRERLEQREVPGSVQHEVMARMDRAGLIDDAAFAHEWVTQRRALRRLGDEALRRELEKRRVDPELIEGALGAGGEQADEEERCRELVRSRLDERDRARLRADRDGSQRRRLSRRLDALLTRKGYPGDLAVQVISSELRAVAGR